MPRPSIPKLTDDPGAPPITIFQSQLRSLLERLSMTQSSLALELGVSQPYISKLLQGARGNTELRAPAGFILSAKLRLGVPESYWTGTPLPKSWRPRAYPSTPPSHAEPPEDLRLTFARSAAELGLADVAAGLLTLPAPPEADLTFWLREFHARVA